MWWTAWRLKISGFLIKFVRSKPTSTDFFLSIRWWLSGESLVKSGCLNSRTVFSLRHLWKPYILSWIDSCLLVWQSWSFSYVWSEKWGLNAQKNLAVRWGRKVLKKTKKSCDCDLDSKLKKIYIENGLKFNDETCFTFYHSKKYYFEKHLLLELRRKILINDKKSNSLLRTLLWLIIRVSEVW